MYLPFNGIENRVARVTSQGIKMNNFNWPRVSSLFRDAYYDQAPMQPDVARNIWKDSKQMMQELYS